MDKKLLNLLAAKKKKESILDKLLQDSFKEQINFVKDSSGRKVALCTRRAGKSYSAGLMMCITGLMYPKSNMVFATMTMKTSKDIMVKDIINPINDKYNLGLELTGYQVNFPNGSVIHLFGVNKDEQQKNKLLGKKNKLFILDEAQDITVDIPDLIERVVDPSLLDNVGQLIMSGTPSDNTATYFYDITNEYKSTQGWSFHRWNCLDNPYVSKQIIRATEEKEALNPLYKTTDVYRQMWLGEWVISKNALIYKPGPQNFDTYSLPGNESDYIWLLGIDLGYVDADGFVIGAYSLNDKHLYIVEAFAQKGNDDVATAMTIKRLSQRISFHRMVVDGSNLKAVETYRQRWQLPLVAAAKDKKADNIRLFNMDLQSGVIKILPKAVEALNSEWKALIWDPKKPGKEKAGLDNHCFIAGTKITTDRGNVNIEDISPFDSILTRDGFKPVLMTGPTGIKQIYKLITEDGIELIGTGNHPIFANNKWIALSELKNGDILQKNVENQELMMNSEHVFNVHNNLKQINIVNKNFVQTSVKQILILNREIVYNLSVKDKPEYFANGILVHNCSDAALYLFRAATNWASITPDIKKLSEEEQYIEELNNYKPKTVFEQLEDRLSFKNMKDSYD